MCPQSSNKPYLHRVSSKLAGSRGVTTFRGSSGGRLASAGAVIGVAADAASMVIGAGVSGVAFTARE